jgi:hypothetical protein
VDLATLKSSQQVSTKSRTAAEPDPAVKKFKDTIKDAEKSTLIFGLNLGKVPLINQDAMSTKVTKAITEKAAQKDGSKGSVPKEDTITALDDVLSIVENVRFYGKTTKSYQNPRDPLTAPTVQFRSGTIFPIRNPGSMLSPCSEISVRFNAPPPTPPFSGRQLSRYRKVLSPSIRITLSKSMWTPLQ